MKNIKFFRITFSIIIFSCILIIYNLILAENTDVFPYQNPSLSIEKRVEDLLSRMTLEEKIAQVSGINYMDTKQNNRLKIPALKMTDGPHGVRWGSSTCFPTLITMGASWNPDLVKKVGKALGQETRAKGRNILLGPCVNIHRIVLGGRNFESFTEDPYLAAQMTVAYVKGVQSQKVGTSVKHFACNNQELDRGIISVQIDERTLREIYLPAFKSAVQQADAWTVMGAYNKINGSYCCANKHLLIDILKNEWKFRGIVLSDWGAVHNTENSANGGLDLEMPGPPNFFGRRLLRAVRNGTVSHEVIDDKVRRILRVMFLMGLFDDGDQKHKGYMNTEEHNFLAREVAGEGIVLLKNKNNILPLKEKNIRSIAVIGPNAAVTRLGGGGSSTVNPPYSVSPLDGLKKKCKGKIILHYAKGCYMPGDMDIISSELLRPAGLSENEYGLKGEYFNNKSCSGKPVLTRIDKNINFNWGGGSPAPVVKADHFSVRWTGQLIPKKSGKYEIGLRSDDGSRLYLDNKLIIDNWWDHGPETFQKSIKLVAGQSYDICLEFYEKDGGAMIKFGWLSDEDTLQKKAVEIARKSDVAVIFAGLSWQIEGEGIDKKDMFLPAGQDSLIKAVAKVNKRTIVVLINGTPVLMNRWLDNVGAVIEAWYPGQEGGHAITDILFGDINPSGKLPVTFPARIEDTPAYSNYPGKNGMVYYKEGIFVGYRHYDKKKIKPVFPFGHGLSYTKFQYSNLKISPKRLKSKNTVNISLDIKNIGKYEGKEVVQLYISDIKSSLERPVKELKAFKKVSFKLGQKKTIRFKLNSDSLSFYNPLKKQWITEPGKFEVQIGSSSEDIRLKNSFMLITR